MSSLYGGSPAFHVFGRLTKDPAAFQTKNGKAYVDFSVAANDRVKQGEEYVDKVCFMDVRAWNSIGENILKTMNKGHRILVEGRIDQENWTTDKGEKRSRHRYVATKVIIVDDNKVSTKSSAPVQEQEAVPA